MSTSFTQPTEQEQQALAQQMGMNELPSFPVTQDQYIPQPEQIPVYNVPQPKYEVPQLQPKSTEVKPPVHNSQESIPSSGMPELQTDLEYITTGSGERIFVNPELGRSTFKGGVTSQQLVSRVSGYYQVNQGLTSDPASGLLQQTASTGDPTKATTWQATILFKILQAFWNALGFGN